MADANREYTEVELLDLASESNDPLTVALAMSNLLLMIRKAREQLATTHSASGCDRTLRLVPTVPKPTPTSNHEGEQ